MDTFYQGLSQHGQVLTLIYDTLIQDNLITDRLRHYPNPMATRYLFNEIDGDVVGMPEGYKWGWSYIPHFIHSRFYCYSDVFGQLLVLALYRMYTDQGRSFVPKYFASLEAGGSDMPDALLKQLGIDMHNPEFWQKGFEEIKELASKLRPLN